MSSDTPKTENETTQTAELTENLPNLTTEQEIQALRSVHEFLSEFDRVPGFLANKWSQALDTIAVVANSLIGKARANGTLSENTETETTQDVTQ